MLFMNLKGWKIVKQHLWGQLLFTGVHYHQNGCFAECRVLMPSVPLNATETEALNRYWILLSPLERENMLFKSGGGRSQQLYANTLWAWILYGYEAVYCLRVTTEPLKWKKRNSQRTCSHDDPFVHSFTKYLLIRLTMCIIPWWKLHWIQRCIPHSQRA